MLASVLAIMAALVALSAVPAFAQQGGDQVAYTTAVAVNDADQYFEQNQVAVQVNDIDQVAVQESEQNQFVAAAVIAGDDIVVDDGSALVVAAEGNQYNTQVGNVAVPIQAVNQEGAAAQYCDAEANALTIQYQNNED